MTVRTKRSDLKYADSQDGWPGIVSQFQLVILAGLRSKQLFNGAKPRIAADQKKQKNTRIALEELRRGLITFKTIVSLESQKHEYPSVLWGS